MSEESKEDEPAWKIKQREYEVKKARVKALKLRTTCTICGAAAKLNCPCGTTQYCTVACPVSYTHLTLPTKRIV